MTIICLFGTLSRPMSTNIHNPWYLCYQLWQQGYRRLILLAFIFCKHLTWRVLWMDTRECDTPLQIPIKIQHIREHQQSHDVKTIVSTWPTTCHLLQSINSRPLLWTSFMYVTAFTFTRFSNIYFPSSNERDWQCNGTILKLFLHTLHLEHYIYY